MKVRKVHYIRTAWLSARYGYTTACVRNPEGLDTTQDATEVTCGSCMKRPEYRQDMTAAPREAIKAPEPTKFEIIEDLADRAEFLGYDPQAAMRVADCLHVAHSYDPCPEHPGHSTAMDMWGYATNECEAHKVLRMSEEQGYTPTANAERKESARQAHLRYLNDTIADGNAVGVCVCWAITERGAAGLPEGGEVCIGCGSIFTPSGTTPVTGDGGPDLPDFPDAPCTRERLEHTATMAADATYAAAHDATLMAMCRAYMREHRVHHRTPIITGYTIALIDYVRITCPDLTKDQAEMVVCEALADACAEQAD